MQTFGWYRKCLVNGIVIKLIFNKLIKYKFVIIQSLNPISHKGGEGVN